MTMTIHYSGLETIVGPMFVATHDAGVCALQFGANAEEDMVYYLAKTYRSAAIVPDQFAGKNALVIQQLEEYFAGTRRSFDLKLAPVGTAFQRKVWSTLGTIPYGETRSYADVAALTGNPKACRAVGNANNKNPISVIIPCHRVIAADGTLGGYGGGEKFKMMLLNHECARYKT